jgi:hypothetical protein
MSNRFEAETLFEFSYVSCLREALPASALLRIDREARANNVAQRLSGELHCADGRFRQVIEGDASAVMALAARILTDPRHDRIDVLALRPIEYRRHDGWQSSGLVPGSERTGRKLKRCENVTVLRPTDFYRTNRRAPVRQGHSIVRF